MQKKHILFLAGFLLALNVFCWQEVFGLLEPKYLEASFLDVGQGDSIFLETPENYQILIDGGPGAAVLQKLAERMPFWDKTIELVILTHPEKDHMQGLLEVLQRYDVKYFLWTGVFKNDAENKKLADLLEKPQNNCLASFAGQTKTQVIFAKAGQEIKMGSVLIDILYPFENLTEEEIKNSSNNASVVSKITYGEDSFLFTGDISSKAEHEMILYTPGVYKADVLKVAHHGSKYSTSKEFLQNVLPEIAVIEVGKNSYGHPTSEVLQRLQEFGIQTLRTDQNGDITIKTDGKNISIKK